MLITIACPGCDGSFGSMPAYEAHRPDGVCIPPADAGLVQRVHRDQSCHKLGTVTYWSLSDAEYARRQADAASTDTEDVKAARRAELFAARARSAR